MILRNKLKFNDIYREIFISTSQPQTAQSTSPPPNLETM